MKPGERIGYVAELKGINLRQLAVSAKIPYNTLYAIVKRKSERIGPETVQKIADTLGVSARYLLDQKQLQGILNYKTAAIRDRIFEAINGTGLSNEEFCLKLGLPIDEWFKWKEASSESYLDFLPQIADLLGVAENELSLGYEQKTSYEQAIRNALYQLNEAGQQEAVKRIEELTEIPKYTVRFEPLTPDEKQLAETGQWGKLWELQFGSRDSAEKPET